MSSRIVVFGAGGRAGREIVTEALRRGHRVTAAVRDPGRYAGPGEVVPADVNDAAAVAAAGRGHDAAVVAAFDAGSDPASFFPGAARAAAGGLAVAGVARLVWLSIGTLRETAPGVRIVDDPGFPAGQRAFSLAHAAALDVLRGTTDPDWVALAPPPTVLDVPGAYGYADLAVTVVDEIEAPRGHRALVAAG
jgi:uncharacterized protein